MFNNFQILRKNNDRKESLYLLEVVFSSSGNKINYFLQRQNKPVIENAID